MHRQWSGLPAFLLRSSWSTLAFLVTFSFWVGAMPQNYMGRTETGSEGANWMSSDEIREELEIIKQRILSDLGLVRIPDVSRANVSSEEMARMLEVYHRSVEESLEEERVVEEDRSTLRFYSYKATEFSSGSSRYSSDERSSFTLHFNLNLPHRWDSRRDGVSLHSARIRVPYHNLRFTHSEDNTTSTSPQIHIYRLLDDLPNAARLLVNAQSFHPGSAPVFVADITNSVRTWIESPSQNFGVQVECYNCNFTATNDLTLLRTNISSNLATPQNMNLTTSLDILVSETSPQRKKRSNPLGQGSSSESRLDCTKGSKTKLCCRRSLKVSFKEIGWNWIEQPKEFEAFYCKGRCSYSSKNFASTHALIQSILHHNGEEVPRPCCAPKKLRALNLLHYNDINELVVTRQKEMIVKECACS